MNTKTNIVAIAAVLTALAVPSIASAQQAIFLPPPSWNQTGATGVPGDAHASVFAPTRHRVSHTVRPYGQW